jgi:transcriptional regulator with XRE-family HTH domain
MTTIALFSHRSILGAMNRLEKAKIIGAMLRAHIEKKGWSVLEAAGRAKIHPSSMRDYVTGITLPMKESREAVADFLGITLDELNEKIGEAPSRKKRPVESICADIRQVDDPEDLAKLLETITAQIVKTLGQAQK